MGSRGDAFLKYIPLNTQENNVFGLSINLQNCFPNIAVLKSARSLNLKPLLSLGLLSRTLKFNFLRHNNTFLFLKDKYFKIIFVSKNVEFFIQIFII